MDISLMSRDEKLLRRLLGESIEIEDPQSRIEFLLKQIIDAGGIGGGSYKIRDQYDTVEELEAAHPTSDPGDAYLVGDPTHIYIWLTDEQKYADGGLFTSVPGLDGVGIVSIDKTSTVGLVDTYTITYTDGDTDTFTVTNGAPGEPGDDGVGIESIEKTSTVGLVDTYTITLTDGTTYDFTVTNGSGGSGVPEGGTTGQVLAKKSDADGDVEWINQSGGSDVSSEIESLSAAASELASENAVQTSEIGSLASELDSMSVSDISSELESLSNQASEHTSEIASLASEMESMSVSDISSELASLSTEASEHESEINSLSIENSTQTSELAAHSQSLSEIASAASSTSTAQSQYDSTQDSHLASLSEENSTQTSELASLSTAESEMASEMETMGSELDEKQPMLTEGPGIDIDDETNEIKTERVVFEGTLQEWEALTTDQKKSYTDAIIINDEHTGIVDQIPTENSNNLITSGGVYNSEQSKADKSNTLIDVTSEFTVNAGVYFQALYNPATKTILLFITGHGSYANGSILITAPAKYKTQVTFDYLLGACGNVRAANEQWAQIVAKAAADGVTIQLLYSQNITAEEIGASLIYYIGQ